MDNTDQGRSDGGLDQTGDVVTVEVAGLIEHIVRDIVSLHQQIAKLVEVQAAQAAALRLHGERLAMLERPGKGKVLH